MHHITQALNEYWNKQKAPWPDYNGNDLFHGDRIIHPNNGPIGTVIFIGSRNRSDDQWFVCYDKESPLSRLQLQVGEKGQAIKITKSKLQQLRSRRDD